MWVCGWVTFGFGGFAGDHDCFPELREDLAVRQWSIADRPACQERACVLAACSDVPEFGAFHLLVLQGGNLALPQAPATDHQRVALEAGLLHIALAHLITKNKTENQNGCVVVMVDQVDRSANGQVG